MRGESTGGQRIDYHAAQCPISRADGGGIRAIDVTGTLPRRQISAFWPTSPPKRTATGKICRLGPVSLPCGVLAQPLMHSQPLLKEFRSMMPNDLKETITHSSITGLSISSSAATPSAFMPSRDTTSVSHTTYFLDRDGFFVRF